MNKFCILLVMAVMAAACSPKITSTPVFPFDFPDPTVLYYNGSYYAYATNGNGKNIQVAVSPDLKSWEALADALPHKPSWGKVDFWAPHVFYDDALKKFVMLYSASMNKDSPKCIGVAYADQPQGPFIDKGLPLIKGSSTDRNNFVNIDPMAFVDPVTGKKLLYWGSAHEPIKVQEMNNDWASFKPGSTPIEVIYVNKEKRYDKLVEGAWVDYHNGRYYLYYSGDNCCGLEANYAVMVARSDKATGPFQTYGEYKKDNNSVIIEKDETVNAPGHNSLIADKRGRKRIVYHGNAMERFKKKDYSRAMYIKRLVYRNGWPVIK